MASKWQHCQLSLLIKHSFKYILIYPQRPAEKTVDCITLDSDSEDEICPPTSKRPRVSAFLDEEDSSSTSSILSSMTPSSESPPPRALSDAMPPPPPQKKKKEISYFLVSLIFNSVRYFTHTHIYIYIYSVIYLFFIPCFF